MQDKLNVTQLCFNMHLNGTVAEREVANFQKAQGDDPCLEVLNRVKKTRDHQVGNGLRSESALNLFRKYAGDYVKAKKAKQARAKEDAITAEKREEVEKFRRSGKQVTPEWLKGLLDEQLDKGEISQSDYNFGIAGLGCVKRMVAEGQAAFSGVTPERESDDKQAVT